METTKVRDLMVPLDQYVCVSEEATLYEAVIALEEVRGKDLSPGHRHRAVLICDKDGRVVGKLGYLDVLRSLEPRYSDLIDLKKVSGFGLSAEFMKSMMNKYELWKAPLDDLCRKASQVQLGSIVAAPLEGEFVDADDTLNNAAHQLIMGHHQSLLVTSNNRVVGVLRLTDVFEEVTKRMRACRA